MRQIIAMINALDGAWLLSYGMIGFFFSGFYSLLILCVFGIFEVFAGALLGENHRSGYIMTIIAKALQCVTVPNVPLGITYFMILNKGGFIKLAPLFPHVISSEEVRINIAAVVLLFVTILLYIRYRRKIKSDMKPQ